MATTDDIEALANLHWLLQEVRGVVHVVPGHSTFWVFATQGTCAACAWDFASPIGWPNVAMLKHRGSVVLGAVDDRGTLRQLLEHPAFIAAEHLSLHRTQVRALHAIIVATATAVKAADVPVRYGVGQQQVWIERLEPRATRIDYETQTRHVADAVLASMIQQSLDEVAQMGGAAGYLLHPNGTPREMRSDC